MPICYGSGGCCCGRHIKRVPQDGPVALGGGAKHGTQMAYELYGCRCKECRQWLAREAMERSRDDGKR